LGTATAGICQRNPSSTDIMLNRARVRLILQSLRSEKLHFQNEYTEIYNRKTNYYRKQRYIISIST